MLLRNMHVPIELFNGHLMEVVAIDGATSAGGTNNGEKP